MKATENSPLAKLAILAGTALLLLICADALVQMRGLNFGFDEARVTADSSVAMLLVGLAVGVPVGVGLFFAYLMRKEKREQASPNEIDQLLDEIARDEDSIFADDFPKGNRDEPVEPLDPWEQPADWWKRGS